MNTPSRKKIVLKRLINQANTIILAWGDNARIKTNGMFASSELPPLYQMMAYQGEAILLGRFFGGIRERIGIEMSPQDYLKFWRHSTEDNGFILDFISRTEWLTVLKINTSLEPISNEQAKQLYCILLAVVAERSPDKLSLVCDDFFIHLYQQQFPETVNPRKDTSTDQLRHKLTHKLRRLTNLPCEVKESFVQSEHSVSFSLRYRTSKKSTWQTLITLERPRLKTARLSAYDTLLEGELEKVLANPYDLASKKKRVVVINQTSDIANQSNDVWENYHLKPQLK